MNGNVWLYILVMAAVTYMVRMLPLALIRREIRSNYVRSFLHYVPFVTLAIMVFPAILGSTAHPASGALGALAAVGLAYRGGNLIQVALLACAVVFAVELVL
jgi:branched-subunit amino acid transport protein